MAAEHNMVKTPSKPDSAEEATVPPPKRTVNLTKDPAYWEALGQFIEAFAGAENLLFNYLVALSRTHVDVAKHFIGGEQVDRLIEHIRQILVIMPTTILQKRPTRPFFS
jgi:hypothetical protein